MASEGLLHHDSQSSTERGLQRKSTSELDLWKAKSNKDLKKALRNFEQQQGTRFRLAEGRLEAEHHWSHDQKRAHIQVALGLFPELDFDLQKVVPTGWWPWLLRWAPVAGSGLVAVVAMVIWAVGLCNQWGWRRILCVMVIFALTSTVPVLIFQSVKKGCSPQNRTVYFNTVKLRVLYTSMMALSVIFSTYSGITIETFLGTFRQEFQGDFAQVHLWALPLIMVMLGIFCEGCITVGLDAAQWTPLVECRVTLLMGFYALNTWKRRWLWGIWLVFFPGLFEVLQRMPLPERVLTTFHCGHIILLVLATPVMWHLHRRTESPQLENKAPRPTFWHCQIVDWIYFLCIEVVPPFMGCWWGLLYHGGASDGRSLPGAFARSFLWTVITLFCYQVWFFQFFNMIIRFKAAHESDDKGGSNSHLGKKLELRRTWMAILNTHGVQPGMLSQLYEHIFPEDDVGSLDGVEHDRTKKLGDQVGVLPFIVSWFCVMAFSTFLDVLLHVTSAWHVLQLTILLGAVTYLLLLALRQRDFRQDPKHSMRAAWYPLVGSWFFWSVLMFFPSVLHVGHEFLALTTFFSFGVVLYFTSLACQIYFPDLVGRSYYVIVLVYVLIIFILALSQVDTISIPATAATVVVGEGSPLGGRWQGPPGTAPLNGVQSAKYGVCSETFGGQMLTAIDLAQLAGVVYEKHCATIREELPALFGLRAPQMHNCSGYTEFPRMAVFDFGEDGDSGMRVVALKGTSTVLDALVDATLYSTVKILQLVGYVLPVIDILPIDQVQWLLWRVHIYGQLLAEERFWKGLVSAVDLIAQGTRRRTMLTGHSLGGAMASVISARLGLPAVVFSAPGTEFSAVRFGVYQPDYWQSWQGKHTPHFGHAVQVSKTRVLNVVPMFDEVPLVDKQLDEVQKIECRGKTFVEKLWWGDANVCHSLMRTACELWRICGDPLHHRRFNCSEFVSRDTLGQFLKPDDPF